MCITRPGRGGVRLCDWGVGTQWPRVFRNSPLFTQWRREVETRVTHAELKNSFNIYEYRDYTEYKMGEGDYNDGP